MTIVWTYDNNPLPWKIVVGQRRAVFNGALALFRKTGFRPISIASRNRGGLSEYAGIFVSDGVQATDWKVSLAEHWASLWETAETEWGKGYYAFRGTYEHGSETLPLFNVLWTKRSPEMKLEMRYNMDESLFNEQDIHWRKSGYHLETTCAYSDTGVTRYAGLWTRSDPYLRVAVGDSLDKNGPTFAARYAPFEDSAIKVMTLEGTKSQGQYFRPSATLHIFEKGELVLNRAYTYAPAHYPDTSLNATMALASASKSITAAAVVKELDTKGIPLTAPFAGAAGIVGVPNMVSTPTIVEVLRNLGGFNAIVDSYSNPSLMNMRYPIDGKAMYDYVVNGHLDAKTTDSYWDIGTYKMSQLGLFVYSNPGFSMLGELVRVQSGVPYAEYVRDSLLKPLNLHQGIYPDAGHRNAVDESTQSGLRSYLINSAHPYTEGCSTDADCSYLPGGTCANSNTCVGCVVNNPDPTQNRPCRGVSACIAGVCTPPTPRLASEAIPKPANGDSSPKWAINAGPVLAAAPDFASVFRYAGRVYMGGAPLAAGGWHGDGESLGLLVRTLAQYDFLMPFSVASQLWDPKWWNFQNDRASKWAYGLGWYARGNWIAMAGGADGTMSIVLHNRQWDFTVVFLANVIGNGFSDFINPLLNAPLGWGSSVLGRVFPCADDPATITGNECGNILAAY